MDRGETEGKTTITGTHLSFLQLQRAYMRRVKLVCVCPYLGACVQNCMKFKFTGLYKEQNDIAKKSKM